VRGRIDEFGDAEIVLVTFTRQRNLRGYRGRLRLPFTVVTDETQQIYRTYGLGKGPWWKVWGVGTIKRYFDLLTHEGYQVGDLKRPSEDTLQLGGDFVVGLDGRLVYVFRSKNVDDRPPIDDLIRAVAQARAQA
jgi:peroxiredoxin